MQKAELAGTAFPDADLNYWSNLPLNVNITPVLLHSSWDRAHHVLAYIAAVPSFLSFSVTHYSTATGGFSFEVLSFVARNQI